MKGMDILINNIDDLIVPISRLNRGEANKVIEEVNKDGIKVVCKNNRPSCVMMSVEKYKSMVEKLNEK